MCVPCVLATCALELVTLNNSKLLWGPVVCSCKQGSADLGYSLGYSETSLVQHSMVIEKDLVLVVGLQSDSYCTS